MAGLFVGRLLGQFFVLRGTGGHPEEGAADEEEDGQGADAPVGVTGDVRHEAHEGGAKEGGAFTDDVVQAEVFAGLFSGDDLCEVGAAHRLNTSLEHADDDGKDPELVQVVEENTVDADAEVRNDADQDNVLRVILPGEFADDEGARESYELCEKKSAEEADRVEAEGRAVGRCHVDDGVDTVNVEEEAEQEQADAFVLDRVLDRMAELLEFVALFRLFRGDEVLLDIGLDERQGHAEPPDAGQNKADGHGVLFRKRPDALVGQNVKCKADNERDDGTNVAPGVPLTGDVVNAVFRGDVVQHGVINDKA